MLFRSARVEVAGGFVGEDQWRIVRQRAGNGNSLLLAAGQLRRVMMPAIMQPDLVEQCLRALARILGERALRYCLYCIPMSAYEPRSLGALRALHMRAFSSMIFDYPLGLALHEEIKRSGGVDAGMWITATKEPPTTAADLHGRAFQSYDVRNFRHELTYPTDVALQTTSPFTWFILHHLDGGRAGKDLALDSTRTTSAASVERVRAIGSGDPRAAQALIDELASEARSADFDPESMKVLPASSVTIRLRVGPPDGIDLPLFTRSD